MIDRKKEAIEMLNTLKESALKSHNDTAVLDIKIDSFNFVIDKAIKLLKTDHVDVELAKIQAAFNAGFEACRKAAIECFAQTNTRPGAKHAIETLKLSNYQNNWISVSDRYPYDIQPVLVTWKNKSPCSYYKHITGKHFTGAAYFCMGNWYWYSSTCADILSEYHKNDADKIDESIEIVAWMPFPESYT